MDRRRFLTLSIAGASAFLTGHSPYRQWVVYRKARLVIAASGGDGAAVRLGERLVRTLAERLPERKATLATASSSRNVVRLLRSGQLDVALLPGDEAVEAATGAAAYGGTPVPLRALAVLPPSVLHLVVRREGGVGGVPDLAGKAVGVGTPGRRTATMLRLVLGAYRMDPERDLRRLPLPPDRAAEALTRGAIDAFAWADALPSEAVGALAAAPGLAIRLLDYGEGAARIEAARGGVYRRATIPAGTYPAVPGETGALAVPHLVVCRGEFPDDRAREIALALGTGPLAGSPLPVHPAALGGRGAETPEEARP